MSTAAEEILLHPESDRPPIEADRRILPYGDDVRLRPAWDEADTPDVPPSQVPDVQPSPSRQPLSVSVDEFGQFVVEDVVGAVYGVADRPEAAFEDYLSALDERLRSLRLHREHLAPKLARQLTQLETLFPGR
jgi:hypothetical protein